MSSPTTAPHSTQNPIPTPTCCTNEVVVQLQTTVLIPDYARFYHGPISSFKPTYIPLADGSLVTRVLVADLARSYNLLFLFGLLAMLFFRNVIVSASYYRRARVSSKALFRMLFISQLLAAIGMVPMIASYFVQSVNCTVAVLFTSAAGMLSLTLLMTGIYGVKVYKCLDNSIFVLVSLVLFSFSILGVAILDLTRTHGTRRISGSCARSTDFFSTSIYLVLQCAQSLFICLCFLYAVQKTRKSPVARGRMSIRLSMDNLSDHHQDLNEVQPRRRGWWDYVPTREPAAPLSPHSDGDRFNIIDSIRAFFSIVGNLFTPKSDDHHLSERKHPVAEELPVPHPPRPSQVRISDNGIKPSEQNSPLPPDRGRLSPAPSSSSHFSRYMPRMELFRNVMKDEVCYTATISVGSVLVAVLSIVGINFTNGLPVTGWISLNWAVTSILTMHSFGRVVHRQERDNIIERAASLQGRGWDERERNRTINVSRHRAPYRRIRGVMGGESVDQDNQSEETRALTRSFVSWDSRFSNHHSLSASSDMSSFSRRTSTGSQMIYIPSPTAQLHSSQRTTQSFSQHLEQGRP